MCIRDRCGAYGVGHVRYPTSGCNSVEEAQASEIRFFDFILCQHVSLHVTQLAKMSFDHSTGQTHSELL